MKTSPRSEVWRESIRRTGLSPRSSSILMPVREDLITGSCSRSPNTSIILACILLRRSKWLRIIWDMGLRRRTRCLLERKYHRSTLVNQSQRGLEVKSLGTSRPDQVLSSEKKASSISKCWICERWYAGDECPDCGPPALLGPTPEELARRGTGALN